MFVDQYGIPSMAEVVNKEQNFFSYRPYLKPRFASVLVDVKSIRITTGSGLRIIYRADRYSGVPLVYPLAGYVSYYPNLGSGTWEGTIPDFDKLTFQIFNDDGVNGKYKLVKFLEYANIRDSDLSDDISSCEGCTFALISSLVLGDAPSNSFAKTMIGLKQTAGIEKDVQLTITNQKTLSRYTEVVPMRSGRIGEYLEKEIVSPCLEGQCAQDLNITVHSENDSKFKLSLIRYMQVPFGIECAYVNGKIFQFKNQPGMNIADYSSFTFLAYCLKKLEIAVNTVHFDNPDTKSHVEIDDRSELMVITLTVEKLKELSNQKPIEFITVRCTGDGRQLPSMEALTVFPNMKINSGGIPSTNRGCVYNSRSRTSR